MRRSGLAISGGVAVLMVSTVAVAAPPDLAQRAEAYLAKAYPADGPGAAAIITENGRTVYVGGRGLADVQGNKTIAPDTVFRLGSITKQFTATAVLKLAEQGKLSLDDPLSEYSLGYPAPGGTATVRQLLNHTSGIMDYTSLPGWMIEANTDKAYTTEQLVAVFKDLPSPSKPGETWQYDNSGYVLLGAVIEKVTGKPWDTEVADLVTGPLHLRTIRSGVAEASIPMMAKGYTDKDGKVVPALKINMTVPGGAGALVGTVGNLADWAYALHNGRVLKPANYAAMIAPTKTADGKTAPYGFGLQSGDVRGRPEIGHGGGIFGFSTDSLYLPAEKVFVAVFANSDAPQISPSLVARRLAAMALGDPYPEFIAQPVDLKAIEPLLGVYAFEDVERVFFARDGKLYTQRAGGGEVEAFAAGGNKYFYGPDSLTWFEVSKDSSGTPRIAFYAEGANKPSMALRKGPPPKAVAAFVVPAAVLDSYAGRYDSAAGAFVIKHDGDGLTVKLAAQPTLPLKALSLTEFEITQVGAKVRFNGSEGKIMSLTLFQGGQELEA
ncbi:MAG: serine hydrolase [Sphingomicrobium sp.]